MDCWSRSPLAWDLVLWCSWLVCVLKVIFRVNGRVLFATYFRKFLKFFQFFVFHPNFWLHLCLFLLVAKCVFSYGLYNLKKKKKRICNDAALIHAAEHLHLWLLQFSWYRPRPQEQTQEVMKVIVIW